MKDSNSKNICLVLGSVLSMLSHFILTMTLPYWYH